MDWRTKSRIIGAVENMPFSANIYYLLQRYVTRSIPRGAESIESVIAYERRHLASFLEFTGNGSPTMVFEFGAGWDLCSAIVRHSLGVGRQQMVDLNRLASTWQINHVIEYLGGKPLKSLDDLETIGITYSAPFDARSTGFRENSVDLITSTNTLEHISPGDLETIFVECHRILAPGGIMSMLMDYSDHYSHADGSISPHNFLQFSDREWSAHNHANHYQNRLRHKDYAEMFVNAGFRILLEEQTKPERPSLPPLDVRFEAYNREELIPTAGYFVVAKISQ